MGQEPGPATFTAAQLAVCLGVTPRAIRKSLIGVPSSGVRVVSGNEAATWSLSQLPDAMRARLRSEATTLRYRDEEAMLSAPVKTWEPPIPLSKICDKDTEQAVKLRDALRVPLLHQHNDEVSSAEFEESGVEAYARCFGHRISRRYWRELFGRTIRRDGGQENWGRLEIYLPERVSPKKDSFRAAVSSAFPEFPSLSSYIDTCKRPASEMEERGIWSMAFQEYASVPDGAAKKRKARALRALLMAKAPFGPMSQDALLKAFQRNLARWEKSGAEGLKDGRSKNGGDDFEFPQEDLDVIESKIIFHYGEYAPAWREAVARGELSSTTMARYGRHVPARKSHVPHKLVATLGKRPVWLYTMHRRRKDFNSLKAHFDTVYDGLKTLACIAADDVTLPIWHYYQPDADTPPIVTRGQCLVFIDLVSKRILGWSLQPDRNYNALVIYTQTARVFAEKGIPRALLFEHGIWERAKIITGTAPFSISEVTQGLKEFGVEFFHADTPQGKWEIEQVMGLVQNLMEGEPGYCGRDERRDRPDWIRKQLLAIESKTNPTHPSEFFYSFEQLNKRLAEIFEEYNATRQDGRLMKGRSPDQVYYDNWDAEDPPIRLGPELHHLLAHAKYKKMVEPSGVTVTSGNRVFKYFGPELRDLVGHEVLVWFNPEFPDVATITDMNRENPVSVPLHTGVPRLERLTDPDGNKLSEECARRDGQVSGIVARYNTLKDKFEMPYRKNLVAARTVAVGKEISQQRQVLQKHKQESAARGTANREKARRLGVPPCLVRDSEEDREALALIEQSRREHQRSKASTGE